MKRLFEGPPPPPPLHEAHFAVLVTMALTNESMKQPHIENDIFIVIERLWKKVHNFESLTIMEDLPDAEYLEFLSCWDKGLEIIMVMEDKGLVQKWFDSIDFTNIAYQFHMAQINHWVEDDGFFMWRMFLVNKLIRRKSLDHAQNLQGLLCPSDMHRHTLVAPELGIHGLETIGTWKESELRRCSFDSDIPETSIEQLQSNLDTNQTYFPNTTGLTPFGSNTPPPYTSTLEEQLGIHGYQYSWDRW